MNEEIKQDIMKRICHMKCLCLDAETTGIQTVVSLNEQGERLQNIGLHLSAIDVALNHTQKHIQHLRGVKQGLIESIRKKFKKKTFNSSIKSRISILSSSIIRTKQSPMQSNDSATHSSESFIDKEIDETFIDIENAVHRLKHLALNMNDQLIVQSDTLDHIHNNITKSTIHIDKQNSAIKKIL